MGALWSHPVWGPGLRALRRSLYAEQVFASVVHEWLSASELAHPVEIGEMAKWTRDTTMYRNLAMGHCIRLHFVPAAVEEEISSIASPLVNALERSRLADQHSGETLLALRESEVMAPKWAEVLLFWHGERSTWLSTASQSIRGIVSKEDWERGMRNSRLSHGPW